MDKLKQDILSIIAEDSRLSAANIAAMIGASEQDVRAAIAELESAGVIVKYLSLIHI